MRDRTITTLTTLTGIAAITAGCLVNPRDGTILSMAGGLLVLVRALLGASGSAHARRAAIVRRETHGVAIQRSAQRPASTADIVTMHWPRDVEPHLTVV